MGPLQMHHNCDMEESGEKSDHMDYPENCRSQENPNDLPTSGSPRATIIFSSSDSARPLTYVPMAWNNSAVTHSAYKVMHEPQMRTSEEVPNRTKKEPQPIPEVSKDELYWEKRKKNNESAKRSRVMRRMKEQQTSMRVAVLEQENMRLQAEVGMLRSELDKMRQLLIPKIGYGGKV